MSKEPTPIPEGIIKPDPPPAPPKAKAVVVIKIKKELKNE